MILASFLWAPLVLGGTDSREQSFQTANRLYSDGHFREAIEHYQKIADTGLVNEVLFYNLGNAYFKDGRLGKAIQFFEKARRISPGDQDILQNLRFAQMQIADKVDSPAEGPIRRILSVWSHVLPLDLETLLSIVCFVGANVCFTLFVLIHSPWISRLAPYGAAVFLFFFFVLGISNVLRIQQLENTREAVVLTDKMDVLSGPSPDNPILFSIHEGLKVRIENQLADWVQISLENGWNGWAKKEDLGTI